MTLEQYRAEFSQHRFLAMPLSGTLAWSVVGIASLYLNAFQSSMLLFVATGSIVYLAMGISKLTGENFFRGSDNPFDRLFFVGLFMSLLVFAIVIPFFMTDYRSITLGVGILSGLMWMPFSWIIESRIGYFHAVARTVLIVAVWHLFPEQHFQAVPAVIVAIYVVTIVALEKRWYALKAT